MTKWFKDLSEREVLAFAISLERAASVGHMSH